MRKMTRVLALLCIMAVSSIFSYSLKAFPDVSGVDGPESVTGTITFTADYGAGTAVDTRVLGSNLPAWMGGWEFQDSTFRARTQATGIELIRMPGGSWSNFYDWYSCEVDGVCPAPGINWSSSTPTDFINFIKAVGGEGMYTINMNDTPEKAAALVAFFNGSVTDPTPIGTDIHGQNWQTVAYWAQMRSQHGNPEPLNVKYWEIGNEIYGGAPGRGTDCLEWGWEEDVWTCDGREYVHGIGTGSNYKAGYLEYRTKMRSIDSSIMVGAVGIPWGNSPYYWVNYNNWGNEVIEEAGSVMDFYIVHQYAYFDPVGDGVTYGDVLAQPQTAWEEIMDDLNQSFDQYAGGRRVPIAVTEHNLISVENNDTQQWMTRGVNMLFMADTIGQMMTHGFSMANQWDLANGWASSGTDYGMMWRGEDFTRSPQYYVFPLWAGFGSQMLPVSSTYNAATTLSVYAGMADPWTATVLAINKTGTAQTATIQINGAPSLLLGGTADTVKASSLGTQETGITYNGVNNMSVSNNLSNAPSTNIGALANPLVYTFEPYSVTLLQLQLGDVISQLSVNDVTVTEGDSGTTNAAFIVSLSPASSETVTVNYATNNGTAAAGSDYTAVSSTLTFNPGQTTKTVNVSVNGDVVQEADETFTLDLSGAVNADISDSQGMATILDDDTPSLTITDASTNEGNSGTTNIVFTIALSEASSQTVTVNYATASGTATENNDYVAKIDQITFTPDQTSKTITVTVNGDTTVEANETFIVTLSNASNANIADANGTGTIIDDDATEWVYLPSVMR